MQYQLNHSEAETLKNMNERLSSSPYESSVHDGIYNIRLCSKNIAVVVVRATVCEV